MQQSLIMIKQIYWIKVHWEQIKMDCVVAVEGDDNMKAQISTIKKSRDREMDGSLKKLKRWKMLFKSNAVHSQPWEIAAS